jgi:hypothetical protein
MSSDFHQIPWSRILLEKLTARELVNKFPGLYGTRSSITAFTSARHLSLFWATVIRFMLPHLTSHFQVVFINSILLWVFFYQRGTRWHSCLSHSSSSLKFAVSITDGVTGFSQWLNLSGRSMFLGLTQSLTEMSTRFFSWEVKAAGAGDWHLYHLTVPTVLKFWQAPPVQTCIGIAIPCFLPKSLMDFSLRMLHIQYASFSSLQLCVNEACLLIFSRQQHLLYGNTQQKPKSFSKSDALHGVSWCAMRAAVETCDSVFVGEMYVRHRNRDPGGRGVSWLCRVQNVRKWCMQFENVPKDIRDNHRTSQPSKSRSQWNFLRQTADVSETSFKTYIVKDWCEK